MEVLMNRSILTAIALVALSFQAHAVDSNKYKQNLAMTCGNVDVLTTAYTTSSAAYWGEGQLVAPSANFELGEVSVVEGNSTVVLQKTEKGARGLFKKKGYGLYEGKNLRLDLRNTVDNYKIFLENTATGERIECDVQGDCC
ncbi:MAG: hypothetical protein COT73_08890 [Bdellovibrio sp. CG10_big_fil_rev_8_21_14_0_10_47_8]|nr:MAG: hypothetical protein COT73_08890 [Bdellovibrio sp. CG10_big_fil_rev_8_21_14_0_10_47_8]